MEKLEKIGNSWKKLKKSEYSWKKVVWQINWTFAIKSKLKQKLMLGFLQKKVWWMDWWMWMGGCVDGREEESKSQFKDWLQQSKRAQIRLMHFFSNLFSWNRTKPTLFIFQGSRSNKHCYHHLLSHFC